MEYLQKSVIVSGLIVLLILLSGVAIAQQGSEEVKPVVVATVNGEKITEQELFRASQLQSIVMTLYQQHRSFYQFLVTTEEGGKLLEEYRNYVLDGLIDQQLMRQKAEEEGIEVPEQDIQAQVDQIVESSQEFEDREDLEEYLEENQKLSLQSLKSSIERDLKVQKLQQEVVEKVSVNEEEIETFYQENKENYTDQEGNPSQLAEVEDQIQDILLSKKQNEAVSKWLQEMREEADITKNPEKL
ncbi:MAG: SurA N-terminal domain-containing protein [Candidatus Acetothermia bacterium]